MVRLDDLLEYFPLQAPVYEHSGDRCTIRAGINTVLNRDSTVHVSNPSSDNRHQLFATVNRHSLPSNFVISRDKDKETIASFSRRRRPQLGHGNRQKYRVHKREQRVTMHPFGGRMSRHFGSVCLRTVSLSLSSVCITHRVRDIEEGLTSSEVGRQWNWMFARRFE